MGSTDHPSGPAPAAIDASWLEPVLACLVAGSPFVLLPRFIFVPSLRFPTLAVHTVALLGGGRPRAARGVPAAPGGYRVAPTLRMMDLYHPGCRPRPTTAG
jgi:hypothetical protein